MPSPLYTLAWWYPLLHTGAVGIDDVHDALVNWSDAHRVYDESSAIENGTVELFRRVQPLQWRLIHIAPGYHHELPTSTAVPSAQHQSQTRRIMNSDGVAMVGGRMVTDPAGILQATTLLTVDSPRNPNRYVISRPEGERPADGPQAIKWRFSSLTTEIPPLTHASPKSALWSLRDAEYKALKILEESQMLARDDYSSYDFRDALIDIEQRKESTDLLAYPPQSERYWELLTAADLVEIIVNVARQWTTAADAALLPLTRAVQEARGNAWNQWMLEQLQQ